MGGTRKATRTYSIHFMLEIGLRPYAFRYLAGVMVYSVDLNVGQDRPPR